MDKLYILYFKKDKKFGQVKNDKVFDIIYNNIAIVPTSTIVKQNKKNKNKLYKFLLKKETDKAEYTIEYKLKDLNKYVEKSYFDNIDKLKDEISQIDSKVPLYDIYSNRIYLIYKENVYNRVIYRSYRFPDQLFFNEIVKIKGEKEKKMVDFLINFNLDILKKTYIIIFYEYSNMIGKNLLFCKRPSFLSHLHYITPHYSRKELINLGKNMGININDQNKEGLLKLCKKIQKNDINSKIILNHQKYIVENNGVHSVIYYSLNGSYFINQYLRDKEKPKNELIENNINKLWKLVKNSPDFDKEYILYRFVGTDKHLQHLKINQIYTVPSFISTTRDPFYKPDTYEFGFILIKIKIPKGIRGVALCMETFSNFPEEQEIIFPPLTQLKLVAKDSNAPFFHIDKPLEQKVVTRYEFEYIGNKPIQIKRLNREIIPENIINFDDINMIEEDKFKDKVIYFNDMYVNKLNQFTSIVDGKKYTFVAEWYDSTNAYEQYYAIKSKNGFMIYTQNPENVNMSLILEISPNEIHVNYYSKYSYMDNYFDLSNPATLKFISQIAYIFTINKVFIYQNYDTCAKFNTDVNDKNRQRILEMYNYRYDYYNYIVEGTKRFHKNTFISPKFFYYQLDDLKKKSPLDILRREDKDELFQIYLEYAKMQKDDTIANFYIYIIQNKSNFIQKLETKMSRIFRDINPFMLDYYILQPLNYLYSIDVIGAIPKIDKTKTDESVDYKVSNKSTYRLDEKFRDRRQ